ncbi:P110/LppT family adhesin N-terminal domain [Mesomycoplasma ovipneumoniae]|uniref:P110/LppT family adhesin N-terminal domain n=1 Tax=Mesomycoplasma ovipneumoniae TaxID=29562 RepID=A0AAW6Q8V9_9BACT|nr:P110/LppT family adhesin N-terminal domain [Mesomycoplasma ovipneumoniae]MDF9627906.1 P110/LppT family adhesin N-terminal domain [Mesomycoplasma ovipneumoniae]MDO4157568.1 P110/LppT family adhesin N-terminal domain [Mesomycoplasma ovipneumoniae]MDO4158655.1 P110/LppT family adhesin N-terminal domain [Mesomycoplasma ovipneumoniae]MDO6821575.1 P110/LppT family adhesin N-terminal domain [Mesomycoplasma ovipneumoniae]MDO6856034.1 P110/LppT family adhesin N-terminal domain [Mesomycoplasma ovipne
MIAKKHIKIITIGLGTTIFASTVVGIALGFNSYNKSYFEKVAEKPKDFKLDSVSSIDKQQVFGLLDKVKIQTNFSDLSAKSALELATNPLYSLDLATVFNFDELKNNGFEISFDLKDVKVENSAINDVLVFVSDPKTNATITKKINLTGFSTKSDSNQLENFDIDTKRSSLILKSRKLVSPSELKAKIQDSYSKFLKNLSPARALERAFIENNIGLNLINGQNLPTFLDSKQIITPVLKDKNLSFSSLDDSKATLSLNLEIQNLDTKTKTNFELPIQGLSNLSQIFEDLSVFIAQSGQDIFKLKPQVQADLINKDESLAEVLYQKANSDFNFSSFFESNFLKSFKFGANDGDIWDLEIIPSLKKVEDSERDELLKAQQVRFLVNVSPTKNQNLALKVTNFDLEIDFQPDLRPLERKIAKAQGSLAKSTNFSFQKPENSPTITATQINLYVSQIFDIIKNNSETEDDKIIEKVAANTYFLEKGKTGTPEEIEQFTKDLQEKIKKDAEIKPQNPDSQNSQQTDNPSSQKTFGLGVSILKTLLLAKNNAQNVELDLNSTPLSKALELNFSLIDKQTGQNLADSKIVISNIFSEKTAYDITREFNPLVFIDGKNDVVLQEDGESILSDFGRPELKFKGKITKENDGYSITKTIKFQPSQTSVTPDSGAQGVAPSGSSGSQTTPQNPTNIDKGSFFLAFKISGINDFNKHYLVSSKEGKGIFVQRVKNTRSRGSFLRQTDNSTAGTNTPTVSEAQEIKNANPQFAYILGTDYDFKFKFANGGDQEAKPVRSQQALILPPEVLKEIKPDQFAELTRQASDETTITLQNRSLLYRKFNQKNNFESDTQFIQDGSTIVVEISMNKETDGSGTLEVSGYSSSSQRPKFDKVYSKTIFNKDEQGKPSRNKFNTYNLDYFQIGPNPDVSVEKPIDSGQPNSSELPKPIFPDSKAKVLIKAFAVVRNSDFGDDENAVKIARDKTLESFVDAYLN